MTECSREAITFSRLPRRRVVADFAGGRLTSDAGLLLLREVDRRLGLSAAISACLPDPRDPVYVVHEQQRMIAQRLFAIAPAVRCHQSRRATGVSLRRGLHAAG